jgi:lactoylglutathione lyase
LPRIDHIAIWAKDVDGLAAFYQRILGAEVGPRYINASKGFSSRFLSFPNGPRIEIMATSTQPLIETPLGSQRLGLAHVAFSLGSEREVDELTQRLREEGIPVLDGPRRTGDGYYESVVLDPEGNRIELTA